MSNESRTARLPFDPSRGMRPSRALLSLMPRLLHAMPRRTRSRTLLLLVVLATATMVISTTPARMKRPSMFSLFSTTILNQPGPNTVNSASSIIATKPPLSVDEAQDDSTLDDDARDFATFHYCPVFHRHDTISPLWKAVSRMDVAYIAPVGTTNGNPRASETTTTPLRCEASSLIALTHADRFSLKMCPMLRTAYEFGIELNVLGWGKRYEGLSEKLVYVAAALRSLLSSSSSVEGDDCLVLFNDAFDVLYGASPRAIREVYLSRWPRRPLVYSGECECFPQGQQVGNLCDSPLVVNVTDDKSYRYLNSGQVIGEARDLLGFYETLMTSSRGFNRSMNDQELVLEFFVNGRSYTLPSLLTWRSYLLSSIIPSTTTTTTTSEPKRRRRLVLDTKAAIFQSLHSKGWCDPREHHLKLNPLVESGGNVTSELRNHFTGGERPMVFHFNGFGKAILGMFAQCMRYTRAIHPELTYSFLALDETTLARRRVNLFEHCTGAASEGKASGTW